MRSNSLLGEYNEEGIKLSVLDQNSELYPLGSKWSVLQGEHEHRPILIRRNDSAKQLQGHPQYIYRVGVAVPFLAPDQHGFPSNDESELLSYIEDALSEKLEHNKASLQVLAITTNGMREFVFYSCNPGIVDDSVRNVRSRFPSHDLQSYIVEDKNWELYGQFA